MAEPVIGIGRGTVRPIVAAVNVDLSGVNEREPVKKPKAEKGSDLHFTQRFMRFSR